MTLRRSSVEEALRLFRTTAARFDLSPIEEAWAHNGPPGDEIHGVGLRDSTFRSPFWGHCSGSSVASTFEPSRDPGCLVSAYGELLENVSCDLWYPDWLPTHREITPLWDEQRISAARCAETLPLKSGIRQCVEASASSSYRVHPYVNVTDPADVLLFPREVGLETCGRNNGGGVGSEPAEAIVAGLLEIFERYAVEKFAFGAERFPLIDPRVFSGARAERIAAFLKGRGCETHYVDMSLGGRLPVVGVLIVRPASNAMSIAVAGSHDLMHAVEHCYREMLSDEFYRDPLVAWPRRRTEDDATRAWSRSGFTFGWGGSLDAVDFARGYSDAYKTAFGGASGATWADNHALLRHCVAISRGFGVEVHARDCSILGVPSFHVYAGALSENMFVAHEGMMSGARNAELLNAVARDRWLSEYLPILDRCRSGIFDEWTTLHRLLDNPLVGFPDDEDVCDYFNWPVTTPPGSAPLASDRRGVALSTLVAGLAYHAGEFATAASLWRRAKANDALVAHWLDLVAKSPSVAAARGIFATAMGDARLAEVERELAVESLIRLPLRSGEACVIDIETRWRRFRSSVYPAQGQWLVAPFRL